MVFFVLIVSLFFIVGLRIMVGVFVKKKNVFELEDEGGWICYFLWGLKSKIDLLYLFL